jgi:hypothetical protein
MYSVLGEARGNGAAAVRPYPERYPHRRLPNPCTFHAIDCRIRETGTVRPSAADRGKRKSARTVGVEGHIPRRVEENPRTSVRRIQAAERVSGSP